MMQIEVVTKPNCAFCVRTKNFLKNHKVDFTETVIGVDVTRDQIIERFPSQKTVPIIVLDGVAVTQEVLEEAVRSQNV